MLRVTYIPPMLTCNSCTPTIDIPGENYESPSESEHMAALLKESTYIVKVLDQIKSCDDIKLFTPQRLKRRHPCMPLTLKVLTSY
ncbi:MAG: hypothetical protein Nkreftii_001219 [Candidatus Nitrospira kreftii]|uniref:Uncharacterized protein n=1 Tax=Candidatus Nitrospira kreftii TaxID=2652173 RepID=A0A7S8FCS8_9BACT|nr:MAG: hypothetical protein Nkreftii_001219 [Candidatus Nitrospira kreftii]